jgi:hypothetical protein
LRSVRGTIVAVVSAVLALGAWLGPASAATPQRLSNIQWAGYQRAYASFSRQTPKSVARFRSCLSSTTGSRDARAMQRCFGNTADLELTQTLNLSSTLQRFQKKTAGACDASLSKYQGQLFFWRSTITGIKRAVHSNVANVATIEGNATHARQIYPLLTSAAKGFAAACKPLARA